MIIEEIKFDGIDPWRLYKRIYDHPGSFILDSPVHSQDEARYSFLGCDPFLIMRGKGGRVDVLRGGEKEEFIGNPFRILSSLLKQYPLPQNDSRHLPLQGGAVGYLSYDLKNFLETLPHRAKDDLNLPDLLFGFYDLIFVYDNHRNEGYIVSTGLPEKNKGKRMLRAETRLKQFKKTISTEELTDTGRHGTERISREMIVSTFTKQGYLEAVEKALRYIAAGDIYQINLSQRFSAPLMRHPLDLYERLRCINPAPMGGFFRFDNFHILSNSPERFLKINGGIIETCPIKGTIERGKDPDEDRRMIRRLRSSAKDKAEHVMIVDLERNDLGKVCTFGSVAVKEFEAIKTYSTLHHMVSRIEGRIKKHVPAVEGIEALFPGGSITGAPKVRAMEIIDELEPTVRGIYTGAIGYIDFGGNADFNIPIRTAVVAGGTIHYQSGGGIVADSDPEKEYNETLLKAQSFFSALDVDQKIDTAVKEIGTPRL
jgi:para-aminobenzoate synthetase component 1